MSAAWGDGGIRPDRVDKCRVDKWLWAVRVFPTRTAATAACDAGRVSINSEPAKPASQIGPGDRVSARRRDRTIVYVVVEPIGKRVSAAAAALCYQDVSPPEAPLGGSVAAPLAGTRPRGEGRPTKRDRRQIDELRGRGTANRP